MIPEAVIDAILNSYYGEARQCESREAGMALAVTNGLKLVCACGEPLTLGVIHHKNAPCEVKT
jgi:hypothetical protein